MLHSYGSPWAVRWFFVDRPLRRGLAPSRDQLLLNYLNELALEQPSALPVQRVLENKSALEVDASKPRESVNKDYRMHPALLVVLTSSLLVAGYALGRSSKR
jgi:hypothetical protein